MADFEERRWEGDEHCQQGTIWNCRCHHVCQNLTKAEIGSIHVSTLTETRGCSKPVRSFHSVQQTALSNFSSYLSASHIFFIAAHSYFGPPGALTNWVSGDVLRVARCVATAIKGSDIQLQVA